MATKEEAAKACKDARGRAKALVTRRVNALQSLITSGADKDNIEIKAQELQEALRNFEIACADYEPHSDGKDPPDYQVGTRDLATACLQQAGLQITASKPASPVSLSGSRQSSVSGSRLLIQAQKATQAAEAEALNYKQQLEKLKLELKQREELQGLAVRAARTEGMELALNELEEDTNGEILLGRLQDRNVGNHDNRDVVRESQLNPTCPPWTDQRDTDDSRNLLTAIKDNQCQQRQMLSLMQLPKVELPKFDGDPLQYWVFMQSFDNMYESQTLDDRCKLSHLLSACSGKARKLIECCMAMNPTRGYRRARELLEERFGNEFDVTQSWVLKVTSGPTIKNNDSSSLQEFSDQLLQCREILDSVSKLHEIDNQYSLSKIAGRLPFYLQNRWRTQVRKIKTKNGRAPKFTDLVQFMKDASDEVNDPVFGKIRESTGGEEKPRNAKGKHNVYTTEAKGENSRQPRVPNCKHCEGSHWLQNCSQFKDLSPQDRLKSTRSKGLCDLCLRPGHRVAKCAKEFVCSVQGCGRKHNSLLHFDQNVNDCSHTTQVKSVNENTHQKRVGAHDKETKSVSVGGVECHVTGAGSQRVVLPIVPVTVMTTGGRRSFTTHALLDSGSTSTFCSAKLAKQLGINGKREKLSVRTLTSQQCDIEVETIKLKIRDIDGEGSPILLPKVYVKPHMEIAGGCIAKQEDLNNYPHLKDVRLPNIDRNAVELLIGQDVPQVIVPEEVRKGQSGEPYAVKTALGWTLNGPLTQCAGKPEAIVNYTQVNSLDSQLKKFWEIENAEDAYSDCKGWSVNDQRVVSTWDETVQMINGHYELPIPFKAKDPELPVNLQVARKRLSSLKRRLQKDEMLHSMYNKEMSDLLAKGYAEEVPECDLDRDDGKIWYLPHHPVVHPRKPGKVRVVFDCASEQNGISLNSEILQGPDLTNNLVGVLLRFREHEVVIKGDIEAMFYQVKVSPNHTDALRYLWWPQGDLSREAKVYRMTTHVFGGVWSPACANYALRKAAADQSPNFGPNTVDAVRDNFYVDDLLKSVPSEEQAVVLQDELREMLSRSGFRLTKWVSNRKRVLEAIPECERAAQAQLIDLSNDTLPAETALGIFWDVESDTLGYRVTDKDKPVTRRGILSKVSAVYDPMGMVGPVTLKAKQILQELTRLKLDWDEPIPPHLQSQWQEWLTDLSKLQAMKIPRCVCPNKQIVRYEIHNFSDACMSGIGVCSYLRAIDTEQQVTCSLLFAKSRLAPIKQMTIPRLELTAAALAVKVDAMLRREIRLPLQPSTFWTDSTVVLSYLNNDDKRFNVFVANRVAKIRQQSDPSRWRYVNTEYNPSDRCSRGVTASALLNCDEWISGPEFLRQPESTWPKLPVVPPLSPDDPEVKREFQVYNTVITEQNYVMERLILRHSSWYKLKKSVAWLLRVRKMLRGKVLSKNSASAQNRPSYSGPISVPELQKAENEIVQLVQRECFPTEIKSLAEGNQVCTSSALRKLDPMLIDGILCVGGRLRNATNTGISKHPVVLPKRHHVVTLIARECHENEGHIGIEHVLAITREKFWIVHGRRAIRRMIGECFPCKKMYSGPGKAKMADLPHDRVNPGDPPFCHVGTDFFGPFLVKRGRTFAKRYGCVFTCLTSRAIHLEVAYTLETDGFINALVRFMSRRGPPKSIRCDNGTNLVGAQRVLQENVRSWNQQSIEQFMLKKEIIWRFNPPYASHMGGVWERQIRSIRRVLGGLLSNQVLDDEGLHTLLCQTESIINSRPLTKVSDDINDWEALTPNHLLLLRGNSSLPLGITTHSDQYSRKRWRQVQYIADEFWKRWSKEYIVNLQTRSKWTSESPKKFEKGNMVLVMSDLRPRNQWLLGRILDCFPGKDGITRVVRVKTAQGELTRPISKLCLLEAE